MFLFDRRGVGSTVSPWRWRVEFERLVRDGNSWCFVGKSAAGSAHLAMAMSAWPDGGHWHTPTPEGSIHTCLGRLLDGLDGRRHLPRNFLAERRRRRWRDVVVGGLVHGALHGLGPLGHDLEVGARWKGSWRGDGVYAV